MPNSLTNQTVIFDTIPPRERISHFQLVHRRRVAALSPWKLVSTTCALVRYTNTRVHISFPLHPRFWNDAGRRECQPFSHVSALHIVPPLCRSIVLFGDRLPAHPLIGRVIFFKKKEKKNTSRSVSQTIKRAPTLIFALRILKYCVVWIKRNVKSIRRSIVLFISK